MPLFSMTGFGRAQSIIDGFGCCVEIKGVNHRYLDISFRGVPISFSLEKKIRDIVIGSIERGRVDITVNEINEVKKERLLTLDNDRIDLLFRQFKKVFRRYGLSEDRDTLDRDLLLSILSKPDLLFTSEQKGLNQDGWDIVVEGCVREALIGFLKSREAEGERLGIDINCRIDRLSQLHLSLTDLAKDIPIKVRDRFNQRISRLLDDKEVPTERIFQEIAILCERFDISEELVRFGVHLDEFKNSLAGGRVGRRLDFIIQELNREINTIGSKVQDAALQGIGIEVKGELERIREQIQNIE